MQTDPVDPPSPALLGTRRVVRPGAVATGLVRPVARVTRATEAYAALRRRILDNVYPPGHQVLESELADELGISRTPMRETMMRLAAEGLVEVVPRHGMRVLPVSPGDMAEIYVVLTALESTAAELLASRRPSATSS